MSPQPVSLQADAVLFDMDGTVVESTAVGVAIWTELAERHGLPVAEVVEYQYGRPARDTLSRFLPAGVELEPVLAELNHRELTWLDGIAEVPGARRLLDALPRDRVAIVTSASRPLAVARLTAAGLDVPAVLIGCDDVAVGKPDPECYREAARRLGVAVGACVVFEDAEAGLLSAVGAGAAPVVVGGLDSVAARGLPRVADLRAVAVAPGAGGAIELRLHGAQPATTDSTDTEEQA